MAREREGLIISRAVELWEHLEAEDGDRPAEELPVAGRGIAWPSASLPAGSHRAIGRARPTHHCLAWYTAQQVSTRLKGRGYDACRDRGGYGPDRLT